MAFYNSKPIRLLPNYNIYINSVNHRGYNTVAPENTLPAFQLSKYMGFDYVETDIAFTSDNVPVLLHDSTINRTSNGTGNIGSMTYNQVRQYDFGSWKDSKYTGTKIPSLEEFLELCKKLLLYPYLELKSNEVYSESQIRMIVDLVRKYGLEKHTTYISFNATYLTYVKNYDNKARLGYLKSAYNESDVTVCNGLKTEHNTVFYDVSNSALDQSVIDAFYNASIPIEVWTVNDAEVIKTLDNYVTGVTSDSAIASEIIYKAFINIT